MSDTTPAAEVGQSLAAAAATLQAVQDELHRVIVGQQQAVELLLIALLSRGHGLFQGVPGLAKSLLVQSLAQVLDCSFARIQFTPDLMPSDITGTEVLQEDRATGRRVASFVRGPLFAQLVLADEVNRTPPRTQAALLQAMQERQVSVAGQTFDLPSPFAVFATQNPIEQEGTYPLPEAQLDRFMFLVEVDYPSADEELLIVQRTTGSEEVQLTQRLTPDRLLELQDLARAIPAGPDVVQLAVELVRSTRPGEQAPDFVNEHVAWGAGPRASQFLVLGAKARALLQGRPAVTRPDIEALAPAVLGHRVLVNFRAEADGVNSGDVVRRLVERLR